VPLPISARSLREQAVVGGKAVGTAHWAPMSVHSLDTCRRAGGANLRECLGASAPLAFPSMVGPLG